ncbi:N-acyl homoserine lactonase family protein [Glaciibacter superstes]|uniref:N-acyl homoserine lactonase family protein n=1 Tax=Glaciibacter superstes TaxID=501023 RepID=UPI00146B1036|nr:N-acyl homoserine lactonase family protein [Glaciibacter superstes]
MSTQADQTHWEVIAVRFGTRMARKSRVYLNYQIYHEPDADLAMDYYYWIARRGDQVILIDTGFNAVSGEKRGRTLLISPQESLTELGIDAGTVEHTIITHMHYDHAGNLNLGSNSQLYLSRLEHNFWTSPMGQRRLFASAVEDDDITAVSELIAAGRLTLTDGDYEVVPGIRALEVGGHTAGELIVIVSTAMGDVVLASDAIHYYEELELDRPFVELDDLPDVFTTFDTVRGLVANGATLVPGHDPEVMRRFPTVPGARSDLAVVIGGTETKADS